jgi:hypothetical protein
VPAALIFLSLVPIIAGAVRLTDLSGGQITPDNARFFDSPVPVLVHIPAGRILAPTGLLAALSGLWMAVFYGLPPPGRAA